MFDNNPFSGFLGAWAATSSAALQWSLDRLGDLANFLGLIDKPPTGKLLPSYTPPFTGGQCLNQNYKIQIRVAFQNGAIAYTLVAPNNSVSYTEIPRTPAEIAPFTGGFNSGSGGIQGVSLVRPQFNGAFLAVNGTDINQFLPNLNVVGNVPVAVSINNVLLASGAADNCGNLPNPNPPYGESANAFESGNPDNGTEGELVAAGLPVLSVAGILAALRAIAEGIAAIGDVLNGIRQIGEAIKQISDLLKEIFDGKKDDDRAKPKYRRYAVGEWYRLPTVDGFIPTTPITLDGIAAIPYKIQVVVESFPSSSSRVLGVLSPSISIDSLPLFYLLLQEDDFGITAVKSIRTLNSSTSIPPFHRGIFWNFRLNLPISAKYRFFYQTEQVEEEVEIQE